MAAFLIIAAAQAFNCVDTIKADSYWGTGSGGHFSDAGFSGCSNAKGSEFFRCANSAKYPVNQTAEVGAVMSLEAGKCGATAVLDGVAYGHVGIVKAVGSGSIQVYEEGWGSDGSRGTHTHAYPCTGMWFIHKASAGGSSAHPFSWLLGPGDFTGDYCEDILGRRTDGTLRLYEGNCAGGFGGQNVKIGTGWGTFNWLLGPGDFDKDGLPDVIARKTDGTLWLYLGNGNGAWITGSGVKIGTGWGTFNWLLGPGDFDGDECADIIGRKSDGTLWLYRGNCKGGWITGTGIKIGTGWGMFDKLLGLANFSGDPLGGSDFSGDGYADVIGRKSDGTLWLYKGNGKGGWVTGTGIKIGTGWGMFDWLLGPSDFSGDGCTDVVGRKADGTLWMYKGNCASGWASGAMKIGTGW